MDHPAKIDGITQLGLYAGMRRAGEAGTLIDMVIATDTPVPSEYDGDGKSDVAVLRNGDWYIYLSNTGTVAGTHFGAMGDEAAPSAIHHP